jgi:hypothetical protein
MLDVPKGTTPLFATARPSGSRHISSARVAHLRPPIYEVDPLICPSCGSEMKVIAFITEHDVVDKILRHLKRRDEEGRGRWPPEHEELEAVS